MTFSKREPVDRVHREDVSNVGVGAGRIAGAAEIDFRIVCFATSGRIVINGVRPQVVRRERQARVELTAQRGLPSVEVIVGVGLFNIDGAERGKGAYARIRVQLATVDVPPGEL